MSQRVTYEQEVCGTCLKACSAPPCSAGIPVCACPDSTEPVLLSIVGMCTYDPPSHGSRDRWGAPLEPDFPGRWDVEVETITRQDTGTEVRIDPALLAWIEGWMAEEAVYSQEWRPR